MGAFQFQFADGLAGQMRAAGARFYACQVGVNPEKSFFFALFGANNNASRFMNRQKFYVFLAVYPLDGATYHVWRLDVHDVYGPVVVDFRK